MGQKVITIVGPTSSGKTYLSIKLATAFNAEIISADSRQIYKRLDIGAAKPLSEDLNTVKHHFINILNPDDNYDANKFSIEAEKVIESLQKKNIPVIVSGGSGLYIKALIDGIVESADKDEELRSNLLHKRDKLGNESLFEELKKVDHKSAENMQPENWKRVIRALEVFYLTGKPIWQHHQSQVKRTKFNFLQIGLMWSREILYKNIEQRVDQMIENGLVDEVRNILSDGYAKDLNSLNTVGYKEIISFLDGEISLERAIELIKRNTRRYAKRQMTWFKADQRIKWYNITSNDDLNKLAMQFEKEY